MIEVDGRGVIEKEGHKDIGNGIGHRSQLSASIVYGMRLELKLLRSTCICAQETVSSLALMPGPTASLSKILIQTISWIRPILLPTIHKQMWRMAKAYCGLMSED